MRMPRIGVSGTSGARNGRADVGVGLAHDQHGGADDDEGEQRADVDQLGQDAERQERAHQADEDAGQDRRLPGGAEPLVDRAEEAGRDQAVAGHRQEARGAG